MQKVTACIADLKDLGKNQRVRIVYRLKRKSVENFAPYVKNLMSPAGQVIPLEESNTLILIDRAGTLRNVVAIIDGIEGQNRRSVPRALLRRKTPQS